MKFNFKLSAILVLFATSAANADFAEGCRADLANGVQSSNNCLCEMLSSAAFGQNSEAFAQSCKVADALSDIPATGVGSSVATNVATATLSSKLIAAGVALVAGGGLASVGGDSTDGLQADDPTGTTGTVNPN